MAAGIRRRSHYIARMVARVAQISDGASILDSYDGELYHAPCSRVEQMNSEVSYRVLRILEEEPEITQRALAERLGVSLGKANYCLKALLRKGFIKARNFKNSGRKVQYVYALTPKGVQERMRVTLDFLRRKSDEFEEIKQEIERITRRLGES
jgi:EPS-associated MarR family transcriptional regulator